ncbi:MAG: cell division protein ZapA [Eubacteriales bacterium]|nr:cell division protein ZapA [Eubacteriales bacterium]
MEKRTVVIYVANQRFAIATEDSDEYVTEVGEKVDVMMKGVAKTNPRLNRDAVATLCALSLFDDLTKLERKQEELRQEIKAYLRDAKALREENSALRAKIAELEMVKISAPDAQASAPKVNTSVAQPEASESSSEAAEETESEQQDENTQAQQKRQLAFSGKNFKSDRKKRHDHAGKRQKQKPWMQAPAEENHTPDSISDEEKGLPDEPPLQYSIFDTDFI